MNLSSKISCRRSLPFSTAIRFGQHGRCIEPTAVTQGADEKNEQRGAYKLFGGQSLSRSCSISLSSAV